MPMNGKSRKERSHRVLVVDDQHLATHVLARLLRRHGYIAAEVNESTKALQVARRFQPDIAILDVHMPWKDGYEVAAEFASDETLREMPIIFITAQALEEDAPPSSVPILFKPFSIQDILGCLKEGITRSFGEELEIEAGRGMLTGSGVR